MVWTKSTTTTPVLVADRGAGVGTPVLALAGIAAALTVIAAVLPIFEVGGFVYTMIGSYRGGGRFVATIAVPLVLAMAVLALGRARPDADVAAATLMVMASLEPIDHITDAAWRRGHPERFGLFEFRVGFFVACAAIVVGAVAFALLMRTLWRAAFGRAPMRTDAVTAIAGLGLLAAVAGQVAESSKAHLWQLPLWLQVGGWWQLAVTTAICGAAVVGRTRPTLAAAVPASIVAAVAAAQQLSVDLSLEDDPAVSTTVTLLGFTLVAVALTPPLIRSVRRR
jgi:hypothetical protein